MSDVGYLILTRSFRSIFRFTKTDIEVFINTLEVSKCKLIDMNCFINAKSCLRDISVNHHLRDFRKLSLFQSAVVIVMNVGKKEGESLVKWPPASPVPRVLHQWLPFGFDESSIISIRGKIGSWLRKNDQNHDSIHSDLICNLPAFATASSASIKGFVWPCIKKNNNGIEIDTILMPLSPIVPK